MLHALLHDVRRAHGPALFGLVLCGVGAVGAWGLWGSVSPLSEAALTPTSGGSSGSAEVDGVVATLRDPASVPPPVAARVSTVDATRPGWLLLVGTDDLAPEDAAVLCDALAVARSQPRTRVFVTDSDRHLVRGC